MYFVFFFLERFHTAVLLLGFSIGRWRFWVLDNDVYLHVLQLHAWIVEETNARDGRWYAPWREERGDDVVGIDSFSEGTQ